MDKYATLGERAGRTQPLTESSWFSLFLEFVSLVGAPRMRSCGGGGGHTLVIFINNKLDFVTLFEAR